MDRVEHVDPGRALRGDFDHVQVGVIAISSEDRRDVLVGGVVDHVLTLTEADLEDPPLPPREHRLAFVLLNLEVRRVIVLRQRVKPHEAAVLFGDHRPRRALALVGGLEQIAGARTGLGGRGDLTVEGVSSGAEL